MAHELLSKESSDKVIGKRSAVYAAVYDVPRRRCFDAGK